MSASREDIPKAKEQTATPAADFQSPTMHHHLRFQYAAGSLHGSQQSDSHHREGLKVGFSLDNKGFLSNPQKHM